MVDGPTSSNSSTTEDAGADGTSSPWQPAIHQNVVVYPATDRACVGLIVEDFGDFDPHAVVANEVRIAGAARRWAIVTTDGNLIFADSRDLGMAIDAASGPNTGTHDSA